MSDSDSDFGRGLFLAHADRSWLREEYADLYNWADFVHNHLPRDCHGSPECVRQWPAG